MRPMCERTVTILGADEADLGRGEVSLYSPIARALLRTRVGDTARLHTPAGVVEVEVLAIRYPGGVERRAKHCRGPA